VYKLWEGCWEPDALVRDKGGVFAVPEKVHRIDHDGPFFTSHGYGNTAATPQGTPVLFQAGSSARGRRFGATHGECIFISGSTAAELARYTGGVREEAARAGRDPRSLKVIAGVAMVIGATREEAERKHREILDSQTPEITVASFALYTGLDLSTYDPDTPMDDLHTEMSQTQITRFSGKTVGSVLRSWHEHGVRGETLVGSAEEIADALCGLAEAADLDGYLVNPLIQPGSTADFIEHVLPLLRARGAFRHDYEEPTLRERLLGPGGPRLRSDHPGASHRFSQSVAA
jgi:long-chain alkane monooxygenase